MASKIGVDKQYWLRRSNMMYYKYIDILVKAFAYDAKSIIDIGSANTEYIESFHWIPKKYTLDIKKPYKSPNVVSIETDFLDYVPDEKFDFATCLQVLEHIKEAEKFAKKLFEVSDRVLISVPYKWPEDAEEEHVNDPVDYGKLKKWTGRDPSYSIIVAEPLRIPSKGISKRLICYYGPEEINYSKANKNVQILNEMEVKHEEMMTTLIKNIENKFDKHNHIQENLQHEMEKLLEEQKKHYQLIDLRLEIYKYEQVLNENNNNNHELEMQIEKINKDINQFKSKIQREVKEQQYYLKEYNKVLNSTSWKFMAPIRSIGKFIRKVIR